MKTPLHNISRKALVLGALIATAHLASAQVTTSTVSTTSAGTVRSFTSDGITMTADGSTAPTHYSYSKTTTYVDENGNPVSRETVTSGMPATVYYTQDGDHMVASKVVFRKTTTSDANGTVSQTTTSSSTSTDGTVSAFNPNSMVVKTTTSDSPMNYTFNKTTTYVDEAGNPVSVETVRSGAPVTVYYDRNGDQMVANRVIVYRSTTVTPDGSVIEKKKTTTTTTTTEPNP